VYAALRSSKPLDRVEPWLRSVDDALKGPCLAAGIEVYFEEEDDQA
jgi:hypothetical protein